MRTVLTLQTGVAVSALVLMSQVAWSQQEAGKKPTKADEQAMMQKWMEAATPGAAHKPLDVCVGKWETSTSIWASGADKPPTVTKGTAEFKWILGGRFLQEDMQGQMMGQPYSGFGITGYDNFNKKYTMFWVDNSSTASFTADGTVDGTGKIFTYYGKMDEPMTGEHGKTVKYVSRVVDANKHTFEIFDLSRPEPDTRMVEITYTRAK